MSLRPNSTPSRLPGRLRAGVDGPQLQVAVRTPAAPVKRDDERTTSKDIVNTGLPTARIGERQVRELRTRSQSARDKPRSQQSLVVGGDGCRVVWRFRRDRNELGHRRRLEPAAAIAALRRIKLAETT